MKMRSVHVAWAKRPLAWNI